MANNNPKKHHYIPQFFMKNFAIDSNKKNVMAVHKHGQRAVWAKKSIKSIAFETELYVHFENETPVSVESAINNEIETPISQSDTWKKIESGCEADLDDSDCAVLYSLVRHLKVRTPHARQTVRELVRLADDPNSQMNFSPKELEIYQELKRNPHLIDETTNLSASNLLWSEEEFNSASLSVLVVEKPTFVCTTPVHSIPVPNDIRLRSTQYGIKPYVELLPLSPRAYVLLALGDFDGGFKNVKVTPEVESQLTRSIVSQFSFFPIIQHMICPSEGLIDHMYSEGYDLVEQTTKKIRFQRRDGMPSHELNM